MLQHSYLNKVKKAEHRKDWHIYILVHEIHNFDHWHVLQDTVFILDRFVVKTTGYALKTKNIQDCGVWDIRCLWRLKLIIGTRAQSD